MAGIFFDTVFFFLSRNKIPRLFAKADIHSLLKGRILKTN